MKMALDAARWLKLMKLLDFQEKHDTFAALQKAYSKPQRHYHTAEHVKSCLLHFDVVKEQIDAPLAVELALWFHDAIYSTRSAKNEEKSAAWAAEFVRSSGGHPDFAENVRELIAATRHSGHLKTSDEKWIVDIDLAILGQDANAFDNYEDQIRQEYKWVPGPVYRRKRAEILQSFLKRESVYATGYFHKKYERQAIANIRRSISMLRSSHD